MAARCCPAPASRPVRAGARRRRPARCCRREPPVRAPARRVCTVEANSRRPATPAGRHLSARKRRGRFHRMGTFGCGLAGDLFLACRVKDTLTLRRNGNDCCQLSPVRDWLAAGPDGPRPGRSPRLSALLARRSGVGGSSTYIGGRPREYRQRTWIGAWRWDSSASAQAAVSARQPSLRRAKRSRCPPLAKSEREWLTVADPLRDPRRRRPRRPVGGLVRRPPVEQRRHANHHRRTAPRRRRPGCGPAMPAPALWST